MKKNKKTKRISYDPNLLNGIEYVDTKSAVAFLRSMISNDVYDKKSPYVPVRMLVRFFDKDKGVRRHGRGGSAALVNYLFRHEEVAKAISSLTRHHNELLSLIYIQKRLVGSDLIEKVYWQVQGIVDEVRRLIGYINKSECIWLFGNTEAINGSGDGRLIGLREIIIRANDSLCDILKQLGRLDSLAHKGKDPLEYSIPKY